MCKLCTCCPCEAWALAVPRPVKTSAAVWQMAEHMWMFTHGSEDVTADVQLIMERRDEISEQTKAAEKIRAVTHGSQKFKAHMAKMLAVCATAKDNHV